MTPIPSARCVVVHAVLVLALAAPFAGVLRAAEPEQEGPGAAAGQARTGPDEARLADLERRIAELKAEVEALLGAGGGQADLEKKIEALSREIERLRLGAAAEATADESVGGMGPAASKVYRTRRGVSIGGYGEMLYVDPSGTRDDGTPSGASASADLLRAILYFGYKFNDRFLFNSEIEIEHALAGDDQPGEVAVEFAYIDYRARPGFGARGGLLLVPVGFVNELHEPPVFFGAHRPEVERYIIPTTWRELGAGVYGDAGPVSWKAYLVTSLDAMGFSAGDGIRSGRQKGAQAVAEDLAFTARVDWVPVQGLLLGVSGFVGDTAQDAAGVDGARLTQWDAHAEWQARGLKVRGLLARTRLDDAAAVSVLTGETIGSRMNGYYLEAGYNLLSLREAARQELSPFIRYEAYDTQAEVAPGFAADPAQDRTVRTYGLHYRPIPNIAIKADWQDRGNAAGTATDRFNLALGWMF